MIGYVRGTISHIMIDTCFVDVQGVGYRVFIASSTRQKLMLNKEITLFTYLNVREDAMNLYGFYTQTEYDLFLKLISVSGIGPKVALGMMSTITVEMLCKSISQKNITALTKLPGIGKKTAERLILELHDKMGFALTEDAPEALIIDTADHTDIISETSQALAALGYTQVEFMPILRKIGEIKSVEEAIRTVLKEFARR
ncbi:MAG: Holliday junction ATP-dependent helicase ruvA [Massilibacillus sp.]|jgi:Holliday junction DNA helicase RuvA|nr:Holliday junction ATP-dependent helicase ruvA [Massilibacillus sp.]